jgi:hypothetical protein
MKPIALSVVCVLAFTAGSTLANYEGSSPRAKLLQHIQQMENLIDEQSRTLSSFTTSAKGISALYTNLDSKAEEVSRAYTRCANGCAGENQAALAAAIQGMQETQASGQVGLQRLQTQMQNEAEELATISNIEKQLSASMKAIAQNL